MMTAKSVPVIDMEETTGSVPEKFVRACEEWGCFRIKNHGIPTSLISQMKTVARALVDRPMEMKMKNANPVEPPKGYTAPNRVAPFLDSLSIYDMFSPAAVEEFCHQLEASLYEREIIQKYSSALHQLVQYVGKTIMEGLGLSGEEFTEDLCQLRLNKYNYNDETVGTKGAVMHSDASLFTILQDDEDVNGLEIVDKITGELVPVDPVPGTMVVIVGDVGKVWSNERFYNVKHHVQCYSPTVRVTLALFVLVPKDKKVQVLPGLVDEEHPCHYVAFDFEHYRKVRYTTASPTGEALQFFRTEQVHP